MFKAFSFHLISIKLLLSLEILFGQKNVALFIVKRLDLSRAERWIERNFLVSSLCSMKERKYQNRGV